MVFLIPGAWSLTCDKILSLSCTNFDTVEKTTYLRKGLNSKRLTPRYHWILKSNLPRLRRNRFEFAYVKFFFFHYSFSFENLFEISVHIDRFQYHSVPLSFYLTPLGPLLISVCSCLLMNIQWYCLHTYLIYLICLSLFVMILDLNISNNSIHPPPCKAIKPLRWNVLLKVT